MTRRTRFRLTAFGALAILVSALFVGVSMASASVSTQLQAAQDNLANCQLLAAHSSGSAQRTRAQQCVTDQQAIIKLLGGVTPSPTAVPTTPAPTPTAAPTPPPTTVPPTTPPATTPPATTPPPVSACPAWPATPDAACTGYKHTGVTLKAPDGSVINPD